MKTIVKFVEGKKINQVPSLAQKCKRCSEFIDNSVRTIKVGSLFIEKDCTIRIDWEWFCEPCGQGISEYIGTSLIKGNNETLPEQKQ